MTSKQPATDPWGDLVTRLVWPRGTDDIGERARRRISAHLIPVLFFLYILAYLDRSNIGVAKLGMMRAPEFGGFALTDRIIGDVTGIFFWG